MLSGLRTYQVLRLLPSVLWEQVHIPRFGKTVWKNNVSEEDYENYHFLFNGAKFDKTILTASQQLPFP